MMIEKLSVAALVVFIAIPAYSFPPSGEHEIKSGQGSKYCLVCHDGLRASQEAMQHPVDVDYRLAQARSEGRLKHVSRLDPATKLENSKVVCMTCHDPESTLPAKLVLSNVGSRLCLSCHDR